MSTNYYYLVSSLPELVQDAKKQLILLPDLKDILAEQLSTVDLLISNKFFLTYDNQNILNLLQKNDKPFLTLGNYSIDILEQNIKEPLELEPYLIRFINAYKTETPIYEDLSLEDNLTLLYYEHLKSIKNSFLQKWFDFDFNLRNVRSAIIARGNKHNQEQVVLGDSPISIALKKSPLRDFGIEEEFPLVEKLLVMHENGNLLQEELDIDHIRWDYLDELNTYNYFSSEIIFSFIIKSIITERWVNLDTEVGRQLFDRILKDIKKSYEFPKEFSINERRKESN